MSRSKKPKTEKLRRDEFLKPAEVPQEYLCPYCKKKLEATEEIACPHCGLPLKRRRRTRQATSQGGHLAKIIVRQPGEKDQELYLSKQITTLGRHPDNMIQLDLPFISGHHATIEFTGSGHTITDLDSTNGIRVNGQLLTPGKAHSLIDKDIIRLNDTRGNSVNFTYVAPSDYGRVADVKRAKQSFKVVAEVSHIGRGFDAAITLSHPAVSWFHAKITRQDDNHYRLEDVSAHNDTFLNGVQLQQPQLLEQGDVIGIGPFNLIYQGHGQLSSFVAERNFNVEAAQLEKTVYGKNWLGLKNLSRPKQILRNIDIDINPREFVALVGGSGSGKSTLMKALIGLSPATGGTVLVNGDNLYQTLDLYRHLIGYVPQDDIIHQDLPVRQALRYVFQLRAPEQSALEGEKIIDEVLAKVGLTDHTETLVGNLSGGQRKRVSIAAELLADPWIFFLDEPTSGLDPGLEKLMMDTLRQLADEGRTIVLVTHATNHLMDHCDQVAFMAHGQLAYFGPPNQAMSYFNVDNFPDIYTALAQPNVEDKKPKAALSWGDRYRQSKLYETYILHRRGGEVARPIIKKDTPFTENFKTQYQQFTVLAHRYLDLIKADRLTLWLLLAVMPLIALFLLLITEGNVLTGDGPETITAILDATDTYTIAADTQRMLFLMALSTTLLGIFGAGYELIKEQAIYQRERMINLRLGPYFASKFVVLGLFLGSQVGLFLIVIALGVDLPSAGTVFWAPLEVYITLLLTVFAGVALGLFISAVASSKDMVTYLILIIILIQIVFSGAIFQLTPITEPLSYLTITRWSLEALGISADIEMLNQLGQVRVENILDTGRGQTILVEDVPTAIDFFINYTRNPLALISRWIFLIAQILVWSYLTIWQIGRQDKI